jgi:hypothetical protein
MSRSSDMLSPISVRSTKSQDVRERKKIKSGGDMCSTGRSLLAPI